jgi:SET domain-containing protein
MLLVKTFLAQSPIDGFGLFARQHIHAGTVVWNFDPRVDLLVETTHVEKLSPAFKEYFEKYSYLDSRVRKYVICGDDSRFVNHSYTPNLVGIYTVGREYGIDIAVREIKRGEELTSDYSTFDADFGSKLNLPNHRHV